MATARARVGALALGGTLTLLLAGVAAGPAAGAALITSCETRITAPGTYLLANDLNCATFGIIVQASNVRLVLGNHTITGPVQTDTFGILVASPNGIPLTGVRVQGGTIIGFQSGLRVGTAPGTHVSSITVSGSQDVGIFLTVCPGCRLVGSRVSNTLNVGIVLSKNALGAQIRGNRVTGSASAGIVVRGSDLSGPGATGARLTGNVVTGNFTDLLDQNPSTAEGCANTWRGNKFATKGGAGAACIR